MPETAEVLRACAHGGESGSVYVIVVGTGAIRFAGDPAHAAEFLRSRGAPVPAWLAPSLDEEEGAADADGA